MIKSRYAKKVVNSSFYGVLRLDGKEVKTLTREEFNEGKQGYIFMDNKTGKIVFDD